MIGLVGICDIRSARIMTRVAKDTKIVNGTKRAMRSVARLSVAPVSLGRTEKRSENKEGQRSTGRRYTRGLSGSEGCIAVRIDVLPG